MCLKSGFSPFKWFKIYPQTHPLVTALLDHYFYVFLNIYPQVFPLKELYNTSETSFLELSFPAINLWDEY